MDPAETSAMIARTIRLRREQLDLNQTTAADQAGLSRRTWNEIENGHRRPKADTLARIEAVLVMPEGSLAALEVVQPTDELMALRRELVDMVQLLSTREELENARLDITRRRLEALQARLKQYEQEASSARQDARTEDDP
jgi:transcriptional regulator with XRE-family HTH domain